MNQCRCELCSTDPEFTWTQAWRAWTEAAEVATWDKERRDGYYKAVLKARGQAAAQALVDAVNRERNDDDLRNQG